MPVYFIQNERGDVKIGHSANPAKRLSSLRVSSSESLTLIRAIEGEMTTERQVHKHFADRHIRGEWFKFHNDMLTIGMTVQPPPVAEVHPLRSYRLSSGIDLRSLAEQCNTTATTICRIEKGRQWPSWELMRRLVDLTGVSAGDFLEFGGSA